MTTLTPALRLPALGVAPAVRREAATQAFARTLAPEDVVTGCSSRGLLGPPQRSYLFAMSSMRPAYLRSELATPSKSEAAEMPTLRGFDEEFGQAAGVTQLDRTRSMLLAVALGAAILGGLTLAWLAVDGSVRPKVAFSAPTSPRNTAPVESRELVDRLLSQVEALKSEVRELTEAQQQPAHAIAAIEAEQESATERRPYTGTRTPLRCRPGSRADLSRGASCRFRDGQRAHVLHCVRCSRPFPRAALRVLHVATVQRSAGAVKAEFLGLV